MFPGHSQRLLRIIDLKVHLDGKLWFSSRDISSLCLAVLSFVALDEALCLVDKDRVSGLRLVLTGHCKRRMEISNIFIHADGLLSLACLDKLSFSLLVSLLVFEFEGVLEMDVADLVLCMQVGHLEGLIELALV